MAIIADHLAHALAQLGITDSFGVMGNGNAYLIDALARVGVGYTPVRHEVATVVAANAYFRASGRVALATTTYGAGYTNTLTGLVDARLARIPLVLAVGEAPTVGSRAIDIDQAAINAAVDIPTVHVSAPGSGSADSAGSAEVSASSSVSGSAATFTGGAAEAVRTAIQLALGQRTPVVLGIPYDLPQQEAGPIQAVTPIQLVEAAAPSPTEVAAVADLLKQAKRPLLLAGRGAHLAGAREALGLLAQRSGALTATTALARSIFPATKYDLGIAGGFGQEEAMRIAASADVAVVFGAGLNKFTARFGSLFAPEAKVVQFDIADAATNPRVDLFVHADARLAAEALAGALGQTPHPWRESVDLAPTRLRPGGSGEPHQLRGFSEPGGHDQLDGSPISSQPDRSLDSCGSSEPGDSRETLASDGRLNPEAVATRLAEFLPADRVVVSDGGHFIGWANTHWSVASPERMIMVGNAFESIGLGFASVPGAAAAAPHAHIVLTTGDGGALMALADLETAIRTTLGRGITIVWNDGQYTAETTMYRDGFGLHDAEPAMLIPEVDFAALGTALGAEGVIVRTLSDLDRVASWATEPLPTRRHLLLDLRISREVVADYQRGIVAVALGQP